MAFSNPKEVFDKMPEVFDADAADDLDAVFQFEIEGDGGGSWNIAIQDGQCVLAEGQHDDPTVTLTMEADVWVDISNGELTGMQAFMNGQLSADGDMMLSQRIPELFPFDN